VAPASRTSSAVPAGSSCPDIVKDNGSIKQARKQKSGTSGAASFWNGRALSTAFINSIECFLMIRVPNGKAIADKPPGVLVADAQLYESSR
jgi:hypothetical protein